MKTREETPEDITRRQQKALEKKRAERRKRVRVGQAMPKLGLSPEQEQYFNEKGEQYHWFNDTTGRLQLKESQDWRYVTQDELQAGGIGRVGDVTAREGLGDKVTRVVGTKDNGEPILAYLMAIPKEFYEDDQAAKSEGVIKKQEAMLSGIDSQGRPGDKEGRYIPQPGINFPRGAKR